MSDRQANFLGLGRREGRWHVVEFFALGLLGQNGLDYWAALTGKEKGAK